MTPTPTSLSERTEELINFDKRLFFAFLVISFLLVRYLTNELIMASIPGHEALAQDGTFTYFHLFNTLNYLWTPFSLLWKFTLTAFLLWLGCFAFGFKVSFAPLWQWVMVVEIIFLLSEIIRLLYFLVIPPETFTEIRQFHPLSLSALFNTENIHQRFHYPLQALNLFELAYWYLLALGIHTFTRRSMARSFVLVLSSYGMAFLFWLLYYVLVYKG